MKNLSNEAIETHKLFISAQNQWNSVRNRIKRELSQYIKDETKDFCKENNLIEQELFLISLDGGSATANWKTDGGWCSKVVPDKDGNSIYHPLKNGNWIKHTFDEDFNVIANEVEYGPVSLVKLKQFAKKLTDETGFVFFVNHEDEHRPIDKDRYTKFINLDGSVHEVPEKECTRHCDCCDCNCGC